MAIGTSDGKVFEDEWSYATSEYKDPENRPRITVTGRPPLSDLEQHNEPLAPMEYKKNPILMTQPTGEPRNNEEQLARDGIFLDPVGPFTDSRYDDSPTSIQRFRDSPYGDGLSRFEILKRQERQMEQTQMLNDEDRVWREGDSISRKAQDISMTITPNAPVQPKAEGNIDLNSRPKVQTPEGVATVRSLSFDTDEGHVLVPSVAHDGSRILTNDEAWQQYKDSGQHLGIFNTSEEADKYAQQLHLDQQQQYVQPTLNEQLTKRFGSPPPALRAFATTVVGDKSKIDEKFFQPEELDILRDTAERSLAKGKKVIGYGDYGDRSLTSSSGTEAATDALTHLPSSLAFTLGMAKVRKEDDGTIVITDKYDFAANKKQVQDLKDQGTWAILKKTMEGLRDNGLLGVGNVIGNLVAPEEGGRDVEIRIPPKSQSKPEEPITTNENASSPDASKQEYQTAFEAAAERTVRSVLKENKPERDLPLANAVTRLGLGLKHLAEVPGKVYKGEIDIDTPEGKKEATDWAASMALTMVMAPAPIAAKVVDGTLGSIAGVTAKTADKEMLQVAQVLDRKGYSNQEIWQTSGWFKGSDGQWRHEIPNSDKAKFIEPEVIESKTLGYRQKASEPQYQETSLSKVFEYPELYKAYPELKGMKVTFKDVPNELGHYAPETKSINLNMKEIKFYGATVEDTLIHEVQHAIQAKEKYSYGTTPRDVGNFISQEINAANKAGDLKRSNQLVDILMDYFKPKDTYKTIKDELYKRSPGEREARLVETRKTWTQEERAAESPSYTQRRIDEITGSSEYKSKVFPSQDLTSSASSTPPTRLLRSANDNKPGVGDTYTKTFEEWKQVAADEGYNLGVNNVPNAFKAAREYSKKYGTATLINQAGNKTIFIDGNKVIRGSNYPKMPE